MQRFNSLVTKFLRLIPMSSPPQNGLFLNAAGQMGYASAGKVQFVAAGPPTAITANGAVDPHSGGSYIITKAGVAALTLAAPTAVVDDGVTISIISGTAFAHTLTATGLLQTGSANVNLATFAAFAGAGLTLRAYNAKWQVVSSIGITFS